MKFKNIKYIGCGLITVLTVTACSDVVNYSDNLEDVFASNGAPVINAIYDVQDTASIPTPLTGGLLNEMLRISGENLSYVKKVTFNGLDVDLRSIYAESKNSYLKVPRKIPQSVTDTLVYETEKGIVTRYFPVSIPKMSVTGLHNEFAMKGDKVQVSGANFDLFGFNDTTATSKATILITNVDSGYTQQIKTDSITEEYMGIAIPKKCPENSLITFTWYEMGVKYTKTIPYKMTKDLMFGNFKGDLGWWNDWGKGLVSDGTASGAPASLGYNYLRVKGTFDSWSWNSTGFGLIWSFADASANPSNYVVKFEVNTNSSYPFYNYGDNGASGAKNGGYDITLNGSKTLCQFDPVSSGLTNTYGKWVTVSMPLDQMCIDAVPVVGNWCSLEFVLQPNTADSWKIDHSFGQFRIEPKNY
jgi:hypothetical protein